MRDFTLSRLDETTDEIWIVEHHPVFTLGQAGDPAHVLDAREIPVVPTDRGGQVTYHGPGQLILYVMHDLRRAGLGVRQFVRLLEQSVIDTLAVRGIAAGRVSGAPGVYIEGRKLAALGVRVRNGCSYHGLAINVDMDLNPFTLINPCGYAGLEVTQLSEWQPDWDFPIASEQFSATLSRLLRGNSAAPA
jgi:lipoyl(octanoyl) transferase